VSDEEAQSQTLSQREIDQLIAAVRSGKIARPRRSLAAVAGARPIDFRDPRWSHDRLVRRRLPVLDLVFNRLAPALQMTLTKSLRFPVRVSLRGIELQQFGDFTERFAGDSTLFEVTRLDPLRGYNVIAMDPVVVYALVDALMGGLGIPEMPEDREISDIEMSLVHRVYSDVLRDLENAWRPWFPLSVEHVRTDRNNTYITTLPKEEVCHVAWLEVTGDVLPPSSLYFVLPYTNAEPLRDAISAGSGEEIDPNWRSNLEALMRGLSTRVTAVLGETRLQTSQITNLAVGDVIQLPVRTSEDVEILVEGDSIFRGRLGRSGLRYGVKITARRKLTERIVDRSVGQTLVRKGLISREQLAVAQIDELLNKRSFVDSVVARGWVDRRVLEQALSA
jgi:flagellar motor switch protein FliM